MQQSKRLVRTVSLAMMGAIAFLMQLFDFPLPMFPIFLQIDFSEIPAILSAVIFGPAAGIWVEAIKNILHYAIKGSETGIPIGQMANFLAGSILAFTTGLVYRKRANLKGLLYGLLLGTIIMAVVMAIANYFVIFTAYAYLLGWVVSSSEKFAIVLYGIAPFNLVKGIILLILMIPLYIRIKTYIDTKISVNQVG